MTVKNEPTFERGAMVKCVDSTALADHITEGSTYRVLRVIYGQSATYDRIEFIDDNGVKSRAFANRFVRAEDNDDKDRSSNSQ